MIPIPDLIVNSYIKHEGYFEIMSDLEIGGLSGENFDDFIQDVKNLRPQDDLKHAEAIALKYGLTELSSDEFNTLNKELMKRSGERSKICFHSESGPEYCDINPEGGFNIPVDCIQKGFLSEIMEDEHLVSIAIGNPEYDGENLGLKVKSKFWGFCNKHSTIFDTIEKKPYLNTLKQNFLFAYRAYIVEIVNKYKASQFIYLGEEDENELWRNKNEFEKALANKDYSCIQTDIVEIPGYYPVFGTSSFQVDFDFEGHDIFNSSGGRIFATLLPQHDKCLFLMSYFKKDHHLSNLTNQIKYRKNFKSDISILLLPCLSNIYFNPSFFYSCIQLQKDDIERGYYVATLGLNLDDEVQITPKEHMQNPYNVNLFGYYFLKNSSSTHLN